MDKSFFFGDAKWVGASTRNETTFSVLRGRFSVKSGASVSLNVLGLGFFKCYINGACINPDTFLPLSSEYEGGCDPVDEVLSGHRIYVPTFDITPYVKEGENVIALHFGGGWYTFKNRVFGLPKAIYRVTVTTDTGEEAFVSDESARIGASYVSDYLFVMRETQDYTAYRPSFDADFDDSAWEHAALVEAPDTQYFTTDCPADAKVAELPVLCTASSDSVAVYDCGRNTTGYPVLALSGKAGETVTVRFSEELFEGGIDTSHMHGQTFTVVCDGTERVVEPDFTWYAFRYFEVTGPAKPLLVKEIYADVPVDSEFDCDNETLNWIYKTFLHTMHCNMHTGHPSDCPHLERRGYTGDGQLTCHAVLSMMDAEAFYRKWLQDIADSQDTVSGHVQYTAPYIRSGGGPGGWGCAIVEVPWQLYRHTGDKEILSEYYGNMCRYIDYLEAHSEFSLVTSDKAGEWCLGDWCGPVILYPEKDITSHNQQVMIPAPYVNTYFMVKSLETMARIAELLGKEDAPLWREKASERRRAIRAAYFNTFDGNFVMNVQGANAFAADLGIGSEKTYENLVKYYTKLGHYDTGIFATDILTRVLFEKGNEELAVDLLTQNGAQGFAHWRENGATTFHEYWDSGRSRSHNHPMFGAVTAYLFEHLLGIGQACDGAGYRDLVIAPKATSRFSRMSGSISTKNGRVSVAYQRGENGLAFKIVIPKGTKAVFRYADKEILLCEGENALSDI